MLHNEIYQCYFIKNSINYYLESRPLLLINNDSRVNQLINCVSFSCFVIGYEEMASEVLPSKIEILNDRRKIYIIKFLTYQVQLFNSVAVS